MDTLTFSETIATWDEALPLGNGQLGCLVWGREPLKFSLDRVDLWDTTPAPQTLRDDFCYQTFLDAARAGDKARMDALFDDCYLHITPTKILGGRLELTVGRSISRIGYTLDRQRALATLELEADGRNVAVEAFVDACSNAGLIRVKGTRDVSAAVIRPAYGTLDGQDAAAGTAAGVSYGNVSELRYPAPQMWDEDGRKGFIQPTNQDFQYGLFTVLRPDADGWLIAFSIVTGKKGDRFAETEAHLNRLLEEGFDAVLARHEAWWRAYNDRSCVTLADDTLQEVWDSAVYLLGSVSRKGAYPMPLQGVFTADDGRLPPWKGDYHNDLNTQVSYAGYLKANRLEQGESFIDYLLSLKEEFGRFAKRYFDADGAISVPGVMTIEGKPMGGWPMYSLNLTNSIWLCRNLEEYYAYTADEAFLTGELYPFMLGVSKSIERWLVQDEKTGVWRLPLSSSPEVHDNTLEACFLDVNTNYDVMLMRYLYEKLVQFETKLGYTREADSHRQMLDRLPPYSTDGTGFTVAPGQPLTESHRHFSHLMAIYPLRTVAYDGENREVIDRSIAHLESLGHGWWVGFSFAWMAELYTITGNGEGAACMLRLFADYLCLPNGFHCNGDYKHGGITIYRYRPVTLESNMFAMAALEDMLLGDNGDAIEVFPAIPASLARRGVSFERLRARGAVLVSSRIQDGRVAYITLEAAAGGTFAVKCPFDGGRVQQESPDGTVTLSCASGDVISVTLKPGETVRLTPAG